MFPSRLTGKPRVWDKTFTEDPVMAEDTPEKKPGDAPIPPRIKLNGVAPPPTSPVAPPSATAGSAAPPPTLPKPGGKSDTSRIELSEARPPSLDLAKKMTARIEIVPPIRIMSEVERMAAAKAGSDKIKATTAPLGRVVTPEVDASKKQTTRIDLTEVLGGSDEDIFKRRTALLDATKIQAAAEAAAQPKTIRIKRPEGPSTGPIKPVSEPMTPAEPVTAEAKKGETARIELPPSVAEETAAEAPTRRKTIRIKRPEGAEAAAVRPLVVSQPTTAAIAAPPTAPKEAEEEAGAFFSVLALAAVLVACVLVYVLSAQVGTLESLAPPNMPFPGGV